MDLESIKELIPLLTSTTEGAFWLIVFLIGQDYLASILTFAGFMIVFYGVWRLIRLAMEKSNWS